jgi:hypothetical protein
MKKFSTFLFALACGSCIYYACGRGVLKRQTRYRQVLSVRTAIARADRTVFQSLAPGTTDNRTGTWQGVASRQASEPRAIIAASMPVDDQHNRTDAREELAKTVVAGPIFEPAAERAGEVQFIGRAPGLSVALTRRGIDVRVSDEGHASAQTLSIGVRSAGPFAWDGEDKTDGESNYFVGNDPQKWRMHVARYGRAIGSGPRGVSLAVYGTAEKSEGIEYDVRTAPAVDVKKLHIELSGARDLKIDPAGDLLMRVGGRELRMNAPAIYEESSYTRTGTHKKTTSGSRSRKSTSTHSRPRGARRETMPRRSTRGPSNAEGRRVRKSMHDYPSTKRKKRRRTTIPKLPLGNDSGAKTGASGLAVPSGTEQSERRIKGGYVLEADGSVGFWLGKHDPHAAIVIDPSLTLTYETFLGGNGTDSVNSMAIDSSGNVYLAGTTTSPSTFPESANATEGSVAGTVDLFVAKVAFSANGVGSLQYLTFFGGSNTQEGGQVAVDPSGNAAVLGTTTSADYPVTDGRVPTRGLTGGKGNDLVVSEVDPTGANLLFSTLFGGSGAESQNAGTGTPLTPSQNIPAGEGAIAFDASGNVYVASDTTSQDLPTTTGAYQTAFGGKATSDGFLAEFQPQNVASGASDLLYCTYLGTNSDSQVAIGGVAVDAATPPNVYIAGTTNNSIDGFPATNAFQSAFGGGTSDAFLMEILPAGAGSSDLIYATLLGGSGVDAALEVAVDTQVPANAYVVGLTQSPAFPETPVIAGPSLALYQPSQPPPPNTVQIQNSFLAVVSWNAAANTSTLQYFTYMGGSKEDAAQSVEAPFSNAVYVGGTATSYDFGWHDNVQAFNGSAVAFVAKLDTTRPGASSLIYATPLGGSFLAPGVAVTTLGNGIAADGRGHVYVAGSTTASNFPTAITSGGSTNGLQQICGSCQESPPQSDAFLTAIQEGSSQRPAVSFHPGNVSFGTSGVQIGTAGVPQPFAIINSGEAPLNISTSAPPSVAGANAADFSVSVASGAGCPQPLPPAGQCQAELNFTPSTGGIEAGVVEINDDAPGSPQLLEVSGAGVAPLAVLPGSFAFQPAPVGIANPQVISVTVTAGVSVSGLNVTTSGPGLAQFLRAAQGAACPGEMSAGSSCTISYAFAPTTVGSFEAEVAINYDLNGSPGPTEILPLTGTSVPAAPIAVVRPSQIVFTSNEVVGATSLAQEVFVSNTGSAPLGFTHQISIGGANAGDFIESDNCGVTLAPGAHCTVNVKFSPQSAGSKIARLIVTDNDPTSPQTVALSGSAILPPGIQIAPTSWGFASQSVGSQSAPEAVTITNVGTVALSFTQGISISGADPSDFSQTSNCSLQSGLQPNQQCTVDVVFSPTAGGPRSANLAVADTAAGSPQTVALSGTGLQANVQISPPSLTFAGQPGTTSAAQTITVASTGPGQPLQVTKVGISGTNAADFAETNTCIGPVTTNCAIQVTFSPICKSEGAARSAIVTVQDNGATPSQTIALSGTASGDFCVTAGTGSLSETVAAGATAVFPAAPATFSMYSVSSFSGSVNLTCASSPAGPACTVLPSATITVSPNVPAQFEVQVVTQGASSDTHNRWPSGMSKVWQLRELASAAFVLLLVVARRRWFAWRLSFAAGAALLFCLGMAACGGSTTTSSDPPTGAYTIAVSATDGTETQNIPLQLNVTL